MSTNEALIPLLDKLLNDAANIGFRRGGISQGSQFYNDARMEDIKASPSYKAFVSHLPKTPD